MLSLHKNKKALLSTILLIATIVPVGTSIINKIAESQNTFAITYPIPSGYTTITDPYFYDCVAGAFKSFFPDESIPSGGLTDQQLAKITQLTSDACNGTGKNDSQKIANVKGIEKMTNLNYMNIGNNKITSIDLSHNTSLQVAYIGGNPFSSLDVSKNTALQQLSVSDTNLTFLDVSKNTQLDSLSLGDFYVKTNAPVTQSGSTYTLNLSGLKWLTGKQTVGNMNPHTIENTENYTYNSDTNIVTITNLAGAGGYIKVRQFPTGYYKLWLAHTLSFDDNGGQGSIANQSCPVGANSCTVTVPSEKPTRSNWDFLGWAETADAAAATIKSGDEVQISSSKVLYAVWAGGFELTYEWNDGQSHSPAAMMQQECAVTPPNTSCEIEIEETWPTTGSYLPGDSYYRLIGYSDSQSDKTAKYHKGDKITLTGNKTLYAIWTPAYALVLTPNDTLGGWLGSCIVVDGSCEIEIPDFDADTSFNQLKKDGYVIIGWSASPNSTTATYPKLGPIALTGNKKLYAVYGPAYTLSFNMNLNGAAPTGYGQQKQCTVSGQACDIKIVTDGWVDASSPYIFKGWADSANATTATYQVNDTVRVSSNKTLYAVWAPARILKYECNTSWESEYPRCYVAGYDVERAQKCEIVDGKCDLKIAARAYLGNADGSAYNEKTFLGWAESPNAQTGTYKERDTITLSTDKTVYAIWGEKALEDQIVSFAKNSIDKTYGDAVFTNAASTTGDGSISYSSSDTSIATVNSTTGAVSIKGAGVVSITAKAAATDSYKEASATYTLRVAKANSSASFANSSVTKTYGDASFTNSVTRTGDGGISYSSSNTNVAEINSETGKVTIKNAGTSTITASVAAASNYESSSASYTLTVSKANPVIAFTNTAIVKTYGDANYSNTANASSDGNITYQSDNTNVASVNSATGEVTIKGAGTATISATVSSTANYNSASTTYTLTVNRQKATIAFANTTIIKTYGDPEFDNIATAASGGKISYSSDNTQVATVDDDGKVTINGAGTATITASVSATTNHTTASATYSLTVNKKASTAPSELDEVKKGYLNDPLSTIKLSTTGLSWKDESTIIKEGHNGYPAYYTENGDTANYTTEEFEITVNGERRIYSVTDGDGQTYVLTSGQYTSFRLSADFSLFEDGGSVYIDDNLVDPQYYTAESGSTIIHMSNNYLETLPVGTHALTVYFKDGGVANATFAVAEITKEEEANILPVPNTASGTTAVPNTGGATSDGHGISVDSLVRVLLVSVITVAFVGGYVYRRKKEHRTFTK